VLAESAVRLTAAAIVVACVPFRRLAATLGPAKTESPMQVAEGVERTAKYVRWAVELTCDRLPFDVSCLAQALAARTMLRRRRITSTLYMGVDSKARGPLRAHAWLRCGSVIVTGEEGYEAYATVATFAEPAATTIASHE
jgi:hypothetical protein